MTKTIVVTFTDDEYRRIKVAADENMTTETSFVLGAALSEANRVAGFYWHKSA